MTYKKLFILIIFFLVSIFFASNAFAAFNLKSAFLTAGGGNNDPLDKVASKAGYDTRGTNDQVRLINKISTIIRIFLSIIGVIFMSLMVYGGYTWMTAMGDQSKAGKAKDLITAAVLGLIIIVAAYAISIFVTSYLVTSHISGAKNVNIEGSPINSQTPSPN